MVKLSAHACLFCASLLGGSCHSSGQYNSDGRARHMQVLDNMQRLHDWNLLEELCCRAILLAWGRACSCGVPEWCLGNPVLCCCAVLAAWGRACSCGVPWCLIGNLLFLCNPALLCSGFHHRSSLVCLEESALRGSRSHCLGLAHHCLVWLVFWDPEGAVVNVFPLVVGRHNVCGDKEARHERLCRTNAE